MNDKIAKSLGFEDAAEFFSMTANVDISTCEKMEAFKLWQSGDGTKAGLMRLNFGGKTR